MVSAKEFHENIFKNVHWTVSSSNWKEAKAVASEERGKARIFSKN